MTSRDGFLRRLIAALAARPSTTTASAPLPARTRLAAALAARPVTRAGDPVVALAGDGIPARTATARDSGAGHAGPPKLTEQVARVVAVMVGTEPDQLLIDADGDFGIRSGSAMIFVRAHEDLPPLVEVFSPLIIGVTPTESLYRRLSELTNSVPIGRIYCTGDTVWASVPVFGENFQEAHLKLAINTMNDLADEWDDQLREEFGGTRFFEDDAEGLAAVPDPTNYLRALARAGAGPARTVLVDLLADRGRKDELQARVKAGDWHAATRLAALLKDQGDTEGAERLWRLAADRGERAARAELGTLLVTQGRVDEAIKLLDEAVGLGDWSSVGLLVRLLAARGRAVEALRLLNAHADRPDDGR